MASPQINHGTESVGTTGRIVASAPDSLTKRVPELDGLRGVAIALVLMVHYGANQLHTKSGTFLNYIREGLAVGWCGVDLFFVLSGFLIGGILIQHRESPNYFRTFYLRRFARIFPLYYAWLFATLLLLALPLSDQLHNVVQPAIPFWSYFTYLQNILSLKLGEFGPEWFGPTWSLAVEEQFYMLFPLLVRFCPPRRLPWWFVTLALSATTFRVFAYFFTPGHGFTGYMLLPCRLDSLLLGALAAWLVRKPGFIDGLRRNLWFLYLVCGLVLTTMLGFRLARDGGLLSESNALLGYLLLATLFCSLLLLALFSDNRWIKAIVSNRWLGKLGVISYGVYLLHQPTSYLLHSLIWHQAPLITDASRLLTTAFALTVTIVLASLSWRFFESRCVNWGHRFVY